VPSLIYTPEIQCHIETAQGKILDISEDLVNWQLELRENAPHTFTFALQNSQRKYDGRFIPMDRIRVALKRINWLQCFTGYINVSPIFQAWPGVLNLTASCTLKLPMYHYWDPNTVEAVWMETEALMQAPNGKSVTPGVDGQDGLTNLIIQSMTKVLDWPRSHIHIGQIPKDWAQFAAKIGEQVYKDTEIYRTLGRGAVINGGLASGPGVNLPGDTYGGVSFSPKQTAWASAIYNEINGPLALANRTDIKVMALMCAMVESGLRMYANSSNPESLKLPHDEEGDNYGSVGLFQQQVSGAPNSTGDWGTTAELMDAAISTKKFVNALKTNLPGGVGPDGGAPILSEGAYGGYVQDTQGSKYPDRYQEQLKPAKAMVAAMDALAKLTPPSSSSDNQGGSGPFGTDPGLAANSEAKSTGVMIARMAANLIHVHADSKNYIEYALGGDNPDHTDVGAVTTLDCSSLVDWVYYAATGGHHLWNGGKKSGSNGRSTVATIHAQGEAQHRIISLELARYVRGVALIAPDHHTGISLGNGTDHVAAHMRYADVSKDCDISDMGGQFSFGVLLPGVNYADSATTPAAAERLKKETGYKKTTVAPEDPTLRIHAPGDASLGTTSAGGGDPTDPANTIDALVNGLYFNADNLDYMGQALGGPVMLANDQPFLPWLQEVVASSMRSFCSAPNGDFIAWFPDYFGVWGTAAVMNIETIELQNFAVYWSDQEIVTHQFVVGNPGTMAFDFATGAAGFGENAPSDLVALAMNNDGVATMDYPEIFEAIYHDGGADSGFIDAFLNRFGARPSTVSLPTIRKGQREFFMALYLFMQRWAGQFAAQIPLTFMPELFPGMLIRIPAYHFQAYVQAVTHSASYGPGGGFTTTVEIAMPATTDPDKIRSTKLALLPQGSTTETPGGGKGPKNNSKAEASHPDPSRSGRNRS
jgi:hypothetical protein